MRRRGTRLRAHIQRLQYRQKLLYSTVALVLLPLLLLSAVYVRVYADSKLNAMLQEESVRIGTEAEKLDKQFYSALQKSVYITNNFQISNLLKQNYEEDLLSFLTNQASVQDALEALKSDSLQSQIYIYGFNPSLYRTQIFKKIEDLDEEIRGQVIGNHADYPDRRFGVSQKDGMLWVHIYNKIMEFSEPLAITEITYPIDETIHSLRELLPANSFVIYAAKDGTHFTMGANGVETQESELTAERYLREGDAGAYYTVTLPVKSAQDNLVLFVSQSSVLKQLAGTLAIPLMMLLGLLLTISVSIRVVTSLLTRRLTDLMSRIRGELDTLEAIERPNPEDERDELGQLDRTFHDMVVQIRNTYRQMADHEISRRLLETELLQVNINPHVLYNTLSAIKWMHPEDEKLDQLIDDMVVFYRLLLNRGGPVATLGQELVLVTKYMDIYRFSYEADFSYSVEMEEPLRDVPILHNMLQPIVENGVIHGLGRKKEGGAIRIAVTRSEDTVLVEITDNGCGMSEEAKTRLLESPGPVPAEHVTPGGSGYALSNIQRRMKLFYGESYGLDIASDPAWGTKVTVRFPAELPNPVH